MQCASPKIGAPIPRVWGRGSGRCRATSGSRPAPACACCCPCGCKLQRSRGHLRHLRPISHGGRPDHPSSGSIDYLGNGTGDTAPQLIDGFNSAVDPVGRVLYALAINEGRVESVTLYGFSVDTGGAWGVMDTASCVKWGDCAFQNLRDTYLTLCLEMHCSGCLHVRYALLWLPH